PYNRRQTLLFTFAFAVVVGAMCLYIFETPNALFTGAGIIICLGYLVAARTTVRPERLSGQQFSLAFLFELFVAFAIALRGFQILQSFDVFEETPNTLVYITFYVLKLLIAFGMKQLLAVKVGKIEVTPIWIYLPLVAATTWMTTDLSADFYHEPLLSCIGLLFWFSAWFALPTVTFFLDIRPANHPTLRYAVWRSVIEILFISPVFCIIAMFFFMLVLMVFGMWPFFY
ncbi:MAG: hypothetical protein J3T61_10760, partial [Candidatus Brocadiales bacterium]|nr:hypothetical protein [Candidatus Bathyanammoxibius sp.]